MEISRQIIESAMHMRTAEMAHLTNYLRETRRETLEKLSAAPTDKLQVLQGEARCLAKILDLIDNAPALLEKQQM